MLAILPQVEQSQLYNSWNRNLPSWFPCNETVSEQLVDVYLLLSERAEAGESFGINMGGTRIDMAYGSYVGSLGSNYILDYFNYGPNMQPDGVLFRESSVRVGDITDGTSTTLMAGERASRSDLAASMGIRRNRARSSAIRHRQSKLRTTGPFRGGSARSIKVEPNF